MQVQLVHKEASLTQSPFLYCTENTSKKNSVQHPRQIQQSSKSNK